MKKLLTIFTIICISCTSNTGKSLAEQFKFLKSTHESEVKLDFSKSEIDLIEDFEQQMQQDFCDSGPYLNGIITKGNEQLTFPLAVYKYCGTLAHFRNRISVIINSKNQVLIDHEFVVNSDDNLEIDLIKATENLMKRESKTTIVYLLEWDTKIDASKMTDRVLEIFSAAKTMLNTLALEKYKKEIDDLSELELNTLKKLYSPMIGIEPSGIVVKTE